MGLLARVISVACLTAAAFMTGAPTTQASPRVGPENFDFLGSAVAVSGQTAVVGAQGVNDDAGAAYIFIRSGSSWHLQAALTDPRGNPNDNFGIEVALSGATAVIGAQEGTFVYVRSGTKWQRQAELPGVSPGGANEMAISGSTIALQISGGVGIYVRAGQSWRLADTLPDLGSKPATDQFGYAVALSGSTIVIGAPYTAKGAGIVYIYAGSGASWKLESTLSNPAAKSGDNFGVDVAISGGTALVGSLDQSNFSNGIAYTYVRSGSHWDKQATIDAPPGDRYLFGEYVALSGATAVLSTLESASGPKVFIYRRSGNRWKRIATFADPGNYTFDYFGTAVALSGPTLVVGADGALGGDAQGAFYVYARSGSSWHQQAEIANPRGIYGASIGSAVAISGPFAIVGSEGGESAYVYVRSTSGWHRRAELNDPDGGFNQFGFSAAISGSTAMVGANDWGSDAGRVFVYSRSGSRWIRRAALNGKHKVAGGGFGTSIAIAGNTALIGAPGINASESSENSGLVFDYQRSGGAWRLRSTIANPFTGFGGAFGSAVAIDGNIAVIGANTVQYGRGAAYVYTRSGNRWHLAAKLTDPDGKNYDDFGSTVAVAGRTVVVGANGVGKFHGAVYLYGQSGATWRREAVLKDPHGVPDANFGWAVSASGAGASTRVVVTELYLSGLAIGPRQCGNSFEYTKNGSRWREAERIEDPGCRSYDEFGYSIALSGKTAIFGAPGNDSNTGTAYVLKLS